MAYHPLVTIPMLIAALWLVPTHRLTAQGSACGVDPLPATIDSMTFTIGGVPIKVCYHRLPSRSQSGTSNWRSIGDAVPVLHNTALLNIGGVAVGSGSFSLYLTPRQGDWLLQVVRMPDPGFEDTAGSIADREVGRAYVPAERMRQPAATLTIEARGSGRTAILFLTWGDMEVTIPVVQQ